jgi:hypothetical protein
MSILQNDAYKLNNCLQLKVPMFYIEVTSGGWSWEKHVSGERGLYASKMKKYKTLLEPIKKGDIILTHLTQSLTIKKEWQGSIVGISTASGPMYETEKRYFIDLVEPVELITPIHFKEYKFNDELSKKFKLAISMSLQIYLINISQNDFDVLIKIHPENYELLKNSIYNKVLFS